MALRPGAQAVAEFEFGLEEVGPATWRSKRSNLVAAGCGVE
jgi:hypothetical protein